MLWRLIGPRSSIVCSKRMAQQRIMRTSETPAFALASQYQSEFGWPSSRDYPQSPKVYTTISLNTINPDFCTRLIPLYQYPFKSSSQNKLGFRYMATNSTNKTFAMKGELQSNPMQSLHVGQMLGYTTRRSFTTETKPKDKKSEEENTTNPPEGFLGSVGKRVNDVNAGDLLSVYGIVALIAVVLVSPYVVRQMRNSDSTYEDLDTDDTVADLAKVLQEEYIKAIGDDGSTLFGGGVGGGLDSIVAELLKSPRIQNAVTDLVTQVLQSPQFKRATQVLLRELWKDLVEDPETLAQVIHLLQNVIQDEQIKEATIQLVMEVFNDKEVLDELVALLERLGQEQEVLSATQALLVESAHNALNDPEILDHSMEFATDVVGDDVVQQTAGEALYNTFSYAVRPTLSVVLSIVGVGFLVISLTAFRNLYASDPSMDNATLTAAIQTSSRFVSNVLSLPSNILRACQNALVSVITFPFRLVGSILRGLGDAGNATVDAINRVFDWLSLLPSRMLSSLVDFFGKGFRFISVAVKERSQKLFSDLSASFLVVWYTKVLEFFSNTHSSLQGQWVSLAQVVSLQTSSVLEKMNSGASAIGCFVHGALEVMKASLSKTKTKISYIQTTWGQTIADSYAVILRACSQISAKLSEYSLSVVQIRNQTVQGIVAGYQSFRHWLLDFATLMERLLKRTKGDTP